MKTTETELLPVRQSDATPATTPTFRGIDIEALLNKAVDSKAAVEVLKELRIMEREMQAERAAQAFNDALSAFQSDCPVIIKEKGVIVGGKTMYAYAPLECIETQIRPFEQKHGFNHTFDTDITSEQGWVIAKCHITHRLGHSRTSTSKFPLGTRTQLMSDTQAYAAAMTFANRRVLCNAYGLVLAGEDMDGRGRIKPAGPSTMRPSEPGLKELAAELWALLKPVRGEEKNWKQANTWLWREEILDGAVPETAPDLTAARFRDVIAKTKVVLHP